MVTSYHDVLQMHAGEVNGVGLVMPGLYSSGIRAVLPTHHGGGLCWKDVVDFGRCGRV